MDHFAVCNIELNHMTMGLFRVLKNTTRIYRAACGFIKDVVEKEWESISKCETTKDMLTYVESLIHCTKNNSTPKYAKFDEEFYKFPSYYRRSAINYVLGQIKSYHTNLADYNDERYIAISNGKRFRKKAPTLNLDANAWPALYKEQLFKQDGRKIRIKVFIRNTWDWVEVSTPMRDWKDFERKKAQAKAVKSPSLVFKYRRFYLVFPIEYPFVVFPDTKLENQTVLAIDLGINRGATCSVMRADGTILERAFDPFTSERDRLNHMLNRLRKVQREAGQGQSLSAFYTKLDGVKENYVRKLSRWICDLAVSHNVFGVVFEHLGRMKGRGRRKDRIHHWCKQHIQDMAKGMLLRNGIRVFWINPKNTSALAFDGSGKVSRDNNNFSLCTFTSGKRYHCDLNASYNIGARYFLRALEKSMPETVWSELKAKVPEFPSRTNYTLATLRAVCAAV